MEVYGAFILRATEWGLGLEMRIYSQIENNALIFSSWISSVLYLS